MPALPVGTAAFQRDEAPRLPLINYYYEESPANLEDQISLRPRARLRLFGSAGAGPIRGLYRKGNVLANASNSGKIICLSGVDLYRVDQNTGIPTLIATGLLGDLRMSAEGNESVVVFAMGDTPYSTDGNTVSAIVMPDGKLVTAIDTLNGYFLLCSELGRFYWTGIGVTTVSALDYATAESSPDVLLTLKVIGDELWLFGRYSIEVWQPTGDLDLPFQRITGRIFGIGITGRMTAQKLNVGGADTVCWVGTDRRVYRTDPNPVRISDNGLEERLGRVSDPTALYAEVDNWDGHDFWVLHIPGEGTFAYDLSTKEWAERTSYGRALFRGAVSTIGVNNQPLLGDDTNGTIWEMTTAIRTDGADPVLFEFSGLIEVAGSSLRCDSVSLDIATGMNPDPTADPTILMATSKDRGLTFGPDQAKPMGRQGQRRDVVSWSRQGLLERPGRVFRWRTTEPATINKAKYNTPTR